MKTKKIYIAGALLVLGLASCTDLDRSPIEQLSDASYWKSNDDAVKAVNDLYNCAPEWNGDAIIGLTDAAINSDDAVHGIKWSEGNISKGIYDPQDFDWAGNYGTIRQTNIILKYVPTVASMSDTEKAQAMAQARFFRAYQYFQLIRQFGDVPYTESPLTLEEQKDVKRAPKAEVYKHILEDFDYAATNLPKTWDGADDARITKGGALAMKARAALSQNDWKVARDAAKAVMDLGVYELYDQGNTGKYKELFWTATDNGCKETVIKKQFIAYKNDWYLIGWEAFPTIGWGGLNPTQSLVDAFEDKDGAPIAKSSTYDPTKPFENRDPRLETVVLHDGESMYGATVKVAPLKSCAPTGIGTHGDATATGYNQQKWLDPTVDPKTDGWHMDMDYKILRYAEVLLTYAEAQNELQPLDQSAFDAVNKVRARVGMPALQKTDSSKPTYCGTQDELRKRIWNEWRVEFALEGGHRQWDIRRWGIAKQVLNAPFYGLTYKLVDSKDADAKDGGKICILYSQDKDAKRVEVRKGHYEDHNILYPIPQKEIDLNPNLTQNAGYSK
ncbi:RagB/SusD family nutrient uptake outer membrane protein [Prevotella sp. S7 MS 2]|uniref:RagB/SusD family nutrient uptake outer membrane protein n=1 Tax=Prevotella sp. S7 MS 2 TaxID=1287488 RepID=UPI0005139C12|nr:RagB/SusD family nutrient uptake outer membrane protein [Prevotella sp. S7 MS 2]KGI59562.1 membrane protein [Prevotella sp. S7 MS 2]